MDKPRFIIRIDAVPDPLQTGKNIERVLRRLMKKRDEEQDTD